VSARRSGRSWRLLLLAGWWTLALVTRAGAIEEAGDTEALWLPSVAVGFDVQVESSANGVVSSSLRGTATGQQEFQTAVPSLEGELMTPVLANPGRARLFFAGEWSWGWLLAGENRPVVKDGTIGNEVLIPPRCQPGNPTRCIESDLSLVEGMGSRLDASIENGWSAGAGVAFEVPVANLFTIIVKPSFLYHGEQVKLEGEVKNPILIVGSSPPNNNTASYVQIAGSEKEIFHALGGRLAIEYEAARRGPFDILLYAQGQLFWWLKPETSFTSSDDSGSATFDYRRNDYVGGGGVGVRLRWRGP